MISNDMQRSKEWGKFDNMERLFEMTLTVTLRNNDKDNIHNCRGQIWSGRKQLTIPFEDRGINKHQERTQNTGKQI